MPGRLLALCEAIPSPRAWLSTRGCPSKFILALVVITAIALRLFGINWDDGHLFHADERAILMHVDSLSVPELSEISQLFDPHRSTLNPKWFPYGSFPLYLLKAAQLSASPFGGLDLRQLAIVGRCISALTDSSTVLLVFFLAKRVSNRRTGILAAGFTALAVLHIQLSHFYTVDTLLTFFVVLSIIACLKAAENSGYKNSIFAGCAIGLALATKASAAPLLLPLAVAHVLGRGPDWRNTWRKQILYLSAALTATILVTFVAQPYAFLDWHTYWSDLRAQMEMVNRIQDYPFTRQYIGTVPFMYQIRQLVLFGLGLPLGVFAFSGLFFAVWIAIRTRSKNHIIVLSWTIPYLLIISSFEVKFLRYLLPATPLLIVFGSEVLTTLLDWTKTNRRALTSYARILILAVCLSTALYAVAYARMGTQTHTAIRASEWFENQDLDGPVTILRENWDDSVPIRGGHEIRELKLYDPDSRQKTLSLANDLSTSDYITIYSNRLYTSISRLPNRYPDTSRYYRLLFGNKLGYELVHFESSYPSLPGIAFVNDTLSAGSLPTPDPIARYRPAFISLNLGYSDDSFNVFDHPLVMIFQNTGHLPKEDLHKILTATEPPLEFTGATMSPKHWAIQTNGATWRKIVDSEGWTSRHPFVAWLLMLYTIWFATTPIALIVFRSLSDRGYLLARPLGLLLAAYIPWILASLNIAPFTRQSVLIGLILLGVSSVWICAHFGKEILTFFRQKWRLLVLSECLFVAAFLFFGLIRMANPDLWHPWYGGEKPMDLAYLNGVVRSTIMPPIDPWFAGGAINYYYFGHFIVACLIKLVGIAPTTAFNLAIPLFFAMTIGAAFSLGFNLTAGARDILQGQTTLKIPRWGSVGAGLAAVLFVGILANLDGAIQLLSNLWARLVDVGVPQPFDYWRASRMMPPDPPGYEITEFPFFTFLFGDLHAHLMAIPLTLLVIGLGIQTMILGFNKRSLLSRVPSVCVLGFSVGALWVTNTWDFPVYLLLSTTFVVMGEYYLHRYVSLDFLLRAIGMTLLIVGSALIFWLPFHTGIETTSYSLRLAPAQTTLPQFLKIYGLFMFISISFLSIAFRIGQTKGIRTVWQSLTNPIALVSIVVLLSMILTLVLQKSPTAAILIIILTFSLYLVYQWLPKQRHPNPNSIPFSLIALALWSASLLITIFVELFAVDDGMERMNTVFKFYLQAWVMLGLSSAYFLWHLLYVQRVVPRFTKLWLTWISILVCLVIAAGSYAFPAINARIEQRFVRTEWTLDGTAYMRDAVYNDEHGAIRLHDDLEAIQWIQRNIDGAPILLEGVTPAYRWGSRISAYTGLPTVIGWEWHETLRKCGLNPCPTVQKRVRAVNEIYSTTDSSKAMELLERYRVTYVYVGKLEELYYPEEGLKKLDHMANRKALSVAYRNDAVTLYKVSTRP